MKGNIYFLNLATLLLSYERTQESLSTMDTKEYFAGEAYYNRLKHRKQAIYDDKHHKILPR